MTFECDDCGERVEDDGKKRYHLPTGYNPDDERRVVCLSCSTRRPSANIYRPVTGQRR